MSAQQQALFEVDDRLLLQNGARSKLFVILKKLKGPLIFLLLLVTWIAFGVAMKNVNGKITELESKSDAYHKHFSFHSRAASAENCQELRSHGFSSSGHFLIDPDGRYSGKPAFEVYCDFDKNLTRVSPFDVTYEPWTVKLHYDDQINALIEASGTCYQHVTFDPEHCLNVYWWEDNRNMKLWLKEPNGIKTKSNSITTVTIQSAFLPIKALAVGRLSPYNCNEFSISDLICSGE